VSLVCHSVIFIAFNRQPESFASVGEQVISVEIVVGSISEAGIAEKPEPDASGEPAPAAPPSEPVPVVTETPVAEEAPKPELEKPVPAMDAVAKPVEEPPKQPVPAQAPPARPEPEPEPDPEPEPVREHPPEPDEKPAPLPPEEPVVAETPPPLPKRDPDPKPEPERPPQEHAKPPEPVPPPPSAPSAAARGIGRGRSDSDARYSAQVVAHLGRHQRYPSDARIRRIEGTVAVTFEVDGTGRVSFVKLDKSSGVAVLDAEAVAMVRRASPFPPPPDGQPKAFAAPVSFSLQRR
jgi:protein TonB